MSADRIVLRTNVAKVQQKVRRCDKYLLAYRSRHELSIHLLELLFRWSVCGATATTEKFLSISHHASDDLANARKLPFGSGSRTSTAWNEAMKTTRASKLRLTLVLAVAAFVFGRATGAGAAPVNLVPGDGTASATRVEVLLEVGGDLKVREKEQVKTLPMSVVGRLRYDERFVQQADEGRTATVVRSYATAEAAIKIADGTSNPKLRPERQQVRALVANDRPTFVSAAGPLTREELDLIEVPFCSALVNRLLPTGQVASGDRWQHVDDLLAGLLGLDAVSQSEVFSELKEVDAQAARIELAGTVQGAIGGIASKFEIKGRYKFSFVERRITWLAVLLEEKRSIGHVAPGTDVVARLQMTLAPAPAESKLSADDYATTPVATGPVVEVLEHQLSNKLRLVYDRRWHVMDEQSDAVALRLVDRGELVAQCNIALQAASDPAKQPTLAKFQDDVKRALGKNFGQLMQAAEGVHALGYSQYRVVAQGSASDLPIEWIYYRLADTAGNQALVAITVEAGQLSLLGGADEALVGTIEFLAPGSQSATTTAGRPSGVK